MQTVYKSRILIIMMIGLQLWQLTISVGSLIHAAGPLI